MTTVFTALRQFDAENRPIHVGNNNNRSSSNTNTQIVGNLGYVRQTPSVEDNMDNNYTIQRMNITSLSDQEEYIEEEVIEEDNEGEIEYIEEEVLDDDAGTAGAANSFFEPPYVEELAYSYEEYTEEEIDEEEDYKDSQQPKAKQSMIGEDDDDDFYDMMQADFAPCLDVTDNNEVELTRRLYGAMHHALDALEKHEADLLPPEPPKPRTVSARPVKKNMDTSEKSETETRLSSSGLYWAMKRSMDVIYPKQYYDSSLINQEAGVQPKEQHDADSLASKETNLPTNNEEKELWKEKIAVQDVDDPEATVEKRSPSPQQQQEDSPEINKESSRRLPFQLRHDEFPEDEKIADVQTAQKCLVPDTGLSNGKTSDLSSEQESPEQSMGQIKGNKQASNAEPDKGTQLTEKDANPTEPTQAQPNSPQLEINRDNEKLGVTETFGMTKSSLFQDETKEVEKRQQDNIDDHVNQIPMNTLSESFSQMGDIESQPLQQPFEDLAAISPSSQDAPTGLSTVRLQLLQERKKQVEREENIKRTIRIVLLTLLAVVPFMIGAFLTLQKEKD